MSSEEERKAEIMYQNTGKQAKKKKYSKSYR